jgi:hypothetical protein
MDGLSGFGGLFAKSIERGFFSCATMGRHPIPPAQNAEDSLA